MIKPLSAAITYFASAALGIFVASLLVKQMTFTIPGLLIGSAVFAVVQLLATPLIRKLLANQNAQALMGGVGIISTFVALVVATLFADGLRIPATAIGAWVSATLIVWVVTALATVALARYFAKKGKS